LDSWAKREVAKRIAVVAQLDRRSDENFSNIIGKKGKKVGQGMRKGEQEERWI
jgi:hypothetical protein